MASNESEMDAQPSDSACRTAQREARKKMLEYCGTRDQKVNATARDMGIISEGETIDLDVDRLLDDQIRTATDASRAALALVWHDNSETGEALIDQHDGDFSAAMNEAWTVTDGLYAPPEPAEDDETTDVTDEPDADDSVDESDDDGHVSTLDEDAEDVITPAEDDEAVAEAMEEIDEEVADESEEAADAD